MGKHFLWASEPKAIFSSKAVAKEPDLSSIARHFLKSFNDREKTLYRNIFRLPSAHILIVKEGSFQKSQYWDVDPKCEIHYRTDEEYDEHFLLLFRDAVRSCLRSHVKVGIETDGGLDSSAIACTAKRVIRENTSLNQGFETFSIFYDPLPCDETPYIEEVMNYSELDGNYFSYKDLFKSLDMDEAEI